MYNPSLPGKELHVPILYEFILNSVFISPDYDLETTCPNCLFSETFLQCILPTLLCFPSPVDLPDSIHIDLRQHEALYILNSILGDKIVFIQ